MERWSVQSPKKKLKKAVVGLRARKGLFVRKKGFTVPQLTKNSPLAKSKVTLVGHGRDGADLRAGRRSRQLHADGTSAKAGTP
jgi:hypothetical protein